MRNIPIEDVTFLNCGLNPDWNLIGKTNPTASFPEADFQPVSETVMLFLNTCGLKRCGAFVILPNDKVMLVYRCNSEDTSFAEQKIKFDNVCDLKKIGLVANTYRLDGYMMVAADSERRYHIIH